MGFEPTISTLTVWRALRAALRGRIGLLLMAQAGFEPAASFVLSEGGLPVAYRAVFGGDSFVPRAGVEPAHARV